MPQFSVPQFVEVEDKIIGPLTLRQFFTFLAGAAIVFALYRIIPSTMLFVLFALPIAGLTLMLTFGKFNGRSFGTLLASLGAYVSQPRAFVFHKQGGNSNYTSVKKETPAKPQVAHLSPEEEKSRLKKLVYVLDQDLKQEKEILGDKHPHLK